VSVAVEEVDNDALNCPAEHRVHTGCAVGVPTANVEKPEPHRVCATHVSLTVDDTEPFGLNVPGAHTGHTGCAVRVPTFSVKVPAAHFV
jgi:hypothetical protein